jgi:hypothetical protein
VLRLTGRFVRATAFGTKINRLLKRYQARLISKGIREKMDFSMSSILRVYFRLWLQIGMLLVARCPDVLTELPMSS